MSKVLIIKHLPTGLSFQDKQQLLKHFGALHIWETKSKRDFVFASFKTEEQAKSSLARLHQLEIAKRRLVVEYSFEKEPYDSSKDNESCVSETTKQINVFLRMLNAWNPTLNFYQPPPPNLFYKYPNVTPLALINITYELSKNQAFYTQTLHLMNKMTLDTPFKDNEEAKEYFKETFNYLFPQEIMIPLPDSETESEISSGEDDHEKQYVPKQVTKRKSALPKTRKRPSAVLSTAVLQPIAKRKADPTNHGEVFESNTTQKQESRKIEVKVSQDALQKQVQAPVEVIGEMGKFQKEVDETAAAEETKCIEKPTISKMELLQNRLSYRDMKMLPVFKNYHPGAPSMRLYLKNLAKTVTEQDITCIYRRYIEKCSEEDQNGFDVRVMQEGRMKGQAFVTFPSVEIAEQALNETNGYMLQEKPMVVQFARAANKKTLD